MAVSSPIFPPNEIGEEAQLQGRLDAMPPYLRSLLKIQVPVVVTLATAKRPVGNVVAMVPGSIIHFEKSCDETLALQIGDQTVAQGEAVKVGDKFGLRITAMVMPDERFHAVRGTGDSQDA